MPNHLEKVSLNADKLVDELKSYLAHDGNGWKDTKFRGIKVCNAEGIFIQTEPLFEAGKSTDGVVSLQLFDTEDRLQSMGFPFSGHLSNDQ